MSFVRSPDPYGIRPARGPRVAQTHTYSSSGATTVYTYVFQLMCHQVYTSGRSLQPGGTFIKGRYGRHGRIVKYGPRVKAKKGRVGGKYGVHLTLPTNPTKIVFLQGAYICDSQGNPRSGSVVESPAPVFHYTPIPAPVVIGTPHIPRPQVVRVVHGAYGAPGAPVVVHPGVRVMYGGCPHALFM